MTNQKNNTFHSEKKLFQNNKNFIVEVIVICKKMKEKINATNTGYNLHENVEDAQL